MNPLCSYVRRDPDYWWLHMVWFKIFRFRLNACTSQNTGNGISDIFENSKISRGACPQSPIDGCGHKSHSVFSVSKFRGLQYLHENHTKTCI